ncbi:hypothetical protein ACFL01_03890, partial [Planctomycetota bacterium]
LSVEDVTALVRDKVKETYKISWWRGFAFGVILEFPTAPEGLATVNDSIDTIENGKGTWQWTILSLRDVHGILGRFADDVRVLMWDVYNEPCNNDKSNELLQATWQWAQETRPSQPLTACIEGSAGEKNLATNAAQSDVITFHCYGGEQLEKTIVQHEAAHSGRPVICTEYMSRELGTTFQHSLPIFKTHRVGCCNWGLVAGKSQTHFNWKTVERLEELRQQEAFLHPGDPIPEPPLWFHDIFRIDGTPFDRAEVDFIRECI